jgi:hypothetical protein
MRLADIKNGMTRTPGEWRAFNMVHEDHGGPMTPEELGEYVKNSVIKSLEFGGSPDRFLFISTGEEDAPDICHVGNGPTGPANARLIAAAPNLLDALKIAAETLRSFDEGDQSTETGWKSEELCAAWVAATNAIDKAEGREGNLKMPPDRAASDEVH